MQITNPNGIVKSQILTAKDIVNPAQTGKDAKYLFCNKLIFNDINIKFFGFYVKNDFLRVCQ